MMNISEEMTKLIDICHDNIKKTRIGKEYIFDKRNISLDIFQKYKIGFFPRNISKLKKYVSHEFLLNVGLIDIRGESQFSDYYSVIFPIYDEYSNPIGIAGRTMLEDRERELLSLPKYKNSKFKKMNNLFGFNFARKDILLKNNVFVVEGYFDQMSMFDSGITNTVAVCGTGFSKNHFIKLARYTDKMSIFLDSDESGQKSASSIYNKYANKGIKLRFVKLPNKYKDAGEYFLDNNKSIEDFNSDIESIFPTEL